MFSYQHHIGDFIRDTSALSDSDAIAYLKLIWMYYDTELPLPAEPKLLAFKIGSTADSVQLILDAYFQLDNNLYHHKRCDAEITAYKTRSLIAKEKANKRWSNAPVMPQHTSSNAPDMKNDANREPITDNQIKDIASTSGTCLPTDNSLEKFDIFWAAYPRKTAKGTAEKSWKKIKPDEQLLAEILFALSKQKSTWTDPKFIPHPATWLNAKRWLDGVDSTAGKKLKYWEKGYQP
jgi:uncharacterized protein YdaU (DUF1376 family)